MTVNGLTVSHDEVQITSHRSWGINACPLTATYSALCEGAYQAMS